MSDSYEDMVDSWEEMSDSDVDMVDSLEEMTNRLEEMPLSDPEEEEERALLETILERMPLSEEPWHCCHLEGKQSDETGSVLKALSRGQPVFWKNGASNSRGLKLPPFPTNGDFIKQIECLLQYVANANKKLAAKSSRLPSDQQVNVQYHCLYFNKFCSYELKILKNNDKNNRGKSMTFLVQSLYTYYR